MSTPQVSKQLLAAYQPACDELQAAVAQQQELVVHIEAQAVSNAGQMGQQQELARVSPDCALNCTELSAPTLSCDFKAHSLQLVRLQIQILDLYTCLTVCVISRLHSMRYSRLCKTLRPSRCDSCLPPSKAN